MNSLHVPVHADLWTVPSALFTLAFSRFTATYSSLNHVHFNVVTVIDCRILGELAFSRFVC